MQTNSISKQLRIAFNSIEDQGLTHNQQLTLKKWNDIINILKTQTNINAEYLKAFNEWFMGNASDEGYIEVPDGMGFADYVLNELDFIIKNPVIVEHIAKVDTLPAMNDYTLNDAAVYVSGVGRTYDPLKFKFEIPRGVNGYGINFFSIDENTGELLLHSERAENIISSDNYEINDKGELIMSFEVEGYYE